MTGRQGYYEECERSIECLVATSYSGPILVLADNRKFAQIITPGRNLELRSVDAGVESAFVRSRILKTSLYDQSPFEETLFLDTDTRVMKPIDPLWSFLKQAPLALGPDKHPDLTAVLRSMVMTGAYTLEEAARTRALCSPKTPFLNSGVILFRRCDPVEEFFKVWKREWSLFKGRDQLALMRAVSRTGIDVARIPLNFNSYAGARLTEEEVIISHYHLTQPSTWARSNRGPKLAIRVREKISRSPFVPAVVKSWLKNLYRRLRNSAIERIRWAVLAHELRDEILGEAEEPNKPGSP